MSRKLFGLWLPVAAFALASGLAACGDDDGGTPPPGPVDLSGTYELVSLTQSGVTLSPPVATGTLTLTATTYQLQLTTPDLQGQPQQTNDNGTYETSGSDWTQQSATGLGTSTGTFTLQGNTLTVRVTAPLVLTTVWNRTG